VIAEHDLDSTAGQSDVRLRVHFASGTINDDGFAFDDIFIYDKPDNDLGVVNFVSPPKGGCSEDSVPVVVTIINFGSQPQTGFPVTANYTGGGGGSLSATFGDTIQAGDTTTFLLGFVNTNAGGTFNFTGYTGLGNDTTNFNDTTLLSSSVTITSTPPLTADVEVCQTDSAQFTLVASPANALDTTIVWFDSLTGGNQLAIGDTFLTPFLSSNTTYYAQAGTGSGASGSLTSFPNFAGGNGQSGNMFDITALAGDITIDSLNVHLSGTASTTIEVYYTDAPGGFAANAGNAAAWTLVGSQTVIGQGAGNPTSVDGLPPFTIPAGQTYGMYVTVAPGTGMSYTNGTTGDFDDNGDIRLDYGFGVAYPFGSTFNVRVWNGTLHYSSGCPSPRIPVQAIILPPAAVDIGPDAIACAGLVADASDPNIASYLWNTGETTPSIVIDTSGTYYVEVVNIDGCVGSDTVNYTILPSPTVDLGPDSLTSCGNVILDAGNPGSTFIWNVAGQFQQTLDVTTSGWYSVEADLNGCTDNDSVYVTILPSPAVDLGADIPACTDVTLDAGNPGATYSWSTGATTQTVVVPAPTAGTDTVSVTVTNSDGCTAVDEIVISVGMPPMVDLGADTTNCDSLTLDAGNPGATYLWNTGATGQTLSVTTPGPYSVTVTDQFGCSNSDDVNVTLEFSPSALFDFDWVNFGYSFEFNNLSTPGATYSWDFGDGSSSTDVNPTHIYAFDGNYTVTLTVTNDCGTDTYSTSTGNVSIDDLFNQSIGIFPNPTRGGFVISSEDLQAEELAIEVYDAKGAIIYRHTKQNVFGLEHPINISTHPKGVYLVKISDGSRTAVKRVIRD
jgi:PKD repeat protein